MFIDYAILFMTFLDPPLECHNEITIKVYFTSNNPTIFWSDLNLDVAGSTFTLSRKKVPPPIITYVAKVYAWKVNV